MNGVAEKTVSLLLATLVSVAICFLGTAYKVEAEVDSPSVADGNQFLSVVSNSGAGGRSSTDSGQSTLENSANAPSFISGAITDGNDSESAGQDAGASGVDVRDVEKTGKRQVLGDVTSGAEAHGEAYGATSLDDDSSATDASSSMNWQSLVTFISLLIALTASVICFYLYRWRRFLFTNPQPEGQRLVPEEWEQSVERNTEKVGENTRSVNDAIFRMESVVQKSVGENTRSVDGVTGKLLKRVEDMVETLMTFTKALDEKDAEIKRLKKGYDEQVFAKFIRRFARLKRQVVKAIERTEGDTKELDKIQLLLEDALEECGVVPFSPVVGADYTQLGRQVADDPKIVETDDPNQEYKIAGVLEEGYRLSDTEERVTIVPARVEIYKLRRGGEK